MKKFMQRFMPYSQYDEERVILQALWPLHRAFPGRFLDIGAFHPTELSNTRTLYEQWNWSGVMFEPSPGPMRTLREAYSTDPRIELVEGAVTCRPGPVEFHITDDAMSTSDEAHFEKWKNQVTFAGVVTVPGITVAEIASRWGAFDFVNIDAEGCSADIFLEMMRRGWSPKCFCVEHDERVDEILGAASGYVKTYENGVNVVLKRKYP
jgi:FkbM family methyltransferase